jgi:hypothetical protein
VEAEGVLSDPVIDVVVVLSSFDWISTLPTSIDGAIDFFLSSLLGGSSSSGRFGFDCWSSSSSSSLILSLSSV